MKRSSRALFIGGIVLAVIILTTFIAAPSRSTINSGSTYSHSPDGYNAWYNFMLQRGTDIKRWQKPFGDLKAEGRPCTVIQISSRPEEPGIDAEQLEWVQRGNNLVILGVREQVTAANFSTLQKSRHDYIKIDTRRRRLLAASEKASLGDNFGAVVWEKHYGKGKVIFSTTRYLAANAYQDYLSNFQYLSDLVKEKDNLLFVDEYIHGYKDSSVRKSEKEDSLPSYLAKTPLFPVLVQIGILLLVVIWAQNRRLQKPVALDTPVVNNSEAYIEALAGVLQKAQSSNFVVEMVGKEEQLQLQKALGLGQELVDSQTLVNAWMQQKGDGTAELKAVLQLQAQKRRISEKDLISWLHKWQSLREIK